MDPRYIALLVAGLHVLTCKTWASGNVSMEDRVEVFLNSQANIPCIYNMDEKAMKITWSKKLPGREQSIRIYDIEGELGVKNENTGQISYTHSYNPSESQGTIILTIDKVQLSDESKISCMVKKNDLTVHGEGHTQLQVFNAPSIPVIVGTHNGISVNEDKPSKVADCKVDNVYPRPNITWYRDTFPLQSSNDVKLMDTVIKNPSGLFTVKSELFLKVVREDEHAEFYCEVNYFTPGEKRMMESDRIKIEVFYPTSGITMWTDPPDRLLKEGDTVEIGCKGNGKPQPLFTFIHNEEVLSSVNELLVFKKVKRSDSGTYVCHTFDLETAMELEDSINITIHYLDEIVVTPKKRVLDQGDDLILTCNALASLQTHTKWDKNGVHVSEGHVLELHNASSETVGMYRCNVTVKQLPELQKQTSFQINVRAYPEITSQIAVGPMNKADHSVNLTCFAQGYPIPNITWDLHDRRLDTKKDIWKNVGNQTGALLTTIAWNNLSTGQPLSESSVEYQKKGAGVLSIISVKATSEFTANCTAFNELGTTSASRDITTFAGGPTTTTSAPHTKATGITVPPKQHQQGGSGVIIAVVIICLLLLAILGSFLYFLYKKGRLPCGRSGKQDFTKEKANKDEIGMKSGKSEEAVLLQGVNGDKKSPTE